MLSRILTKRSEVIHFYQISNISNNIISTTLLGCPGPGQPENTNLYDIIVDNKSATDNYKNILFLALIVLYAGIVFTNRSGWEHWDSAIPSKYSAYFYCGSDFLPHH